MLAAVGGGSLGALPYVGDGARIGLLVVAAGSIQLRLLANLMDGMVAIEGGRRSAAGELFNEIPDRFADLFFLVGTGYAVTWLSWGEMLGWAAGAAALLTAYVRLLGGALGVTQHFCGPMAKPHRMALLTGACLASIVEVAFGYEGRVLTVGLALIVAGSLLTFARRVRLIGRELSAR